MEGYATEILKEVFPREMDDITEDLLQTEKENEAKIISQKSFEELLQEEGELKAHWDKLKKENFCLQATINAWQSTLEKKLEEFKEAEIELDETHTEIWSEREKFCLSVDKFNNDYGILSDWWQQQMNFVSDLENLEKKRSEDQKRHKEIEKLENEIEKIKNKIENLEKRREIAEIEIHSSPEGEPTFFRGEHSRDILGNNKKRIFEAENKIAGELFSLVNVEKVRAANRKNARSKALLKKVKQLLIK